MANAALTIRLADEADRPSVWPLTRDFATSFEPVKEAFDRSFRELLGATRTLVLVAETASDGVIGYLLGNSHLTFLANGPVAWVEEVMVAEQARRRGVGRALMARAERWAQEIGAAYLSLASRRAGDFYRALDYEDSAIFYKKTFTGAST
jgi:GNAT superfamily N-acetyltransferase